MQRALRHIACTLIGLCLSSMVLADYSREYIDGHPLQITQANGLDLAYRMVGEQTDPVVVMIMGLGASHAVWGDDLVKGLVDSGYQVLLFDNRDVGGSTRFDGWGEPTLWWQLLKYTLGFDVDAPYNLNDMAQDTVALMDQMGITKAHIVGASMGGMVAQIVTARHPEKITSLTSIMSTTNAPHLPKPSSDAENSLRDLAEGEAAEARQAAMRKRGFYIESIPRQIMGILKTGDRTEEVATITSPTLVLHGRDDQLIKLAHGQHTADTIKGAKFVVFEDMGHNLPEAVLPQILNSMVKHFEQVSDPQIKTVSMR